MFLMTFKLACFWGHAQLYALRSSKHHTAYAFYLGNPRAHRSLRQDCSACQPRDGVADTAVRQPACIATVISQKFPGSEYLAHFSNLSTIIETSLHRFVIGQLGGVDQVVKSACREKEEGQWACLELSQERWKEPQMEVFLNAGVYRAVSVQRF